jgi:glycosyltransferase involved in cell wall biosynthesis
VPRIAPLKIAIATHIAATDAGGVSQATLGLMHALGELDGPETYDVVVSSDDVQSLLEPYVGSAQRIRRRPPDWRRGRSGGMRKAVKARLARAVQHELDLWPSVPISDGFFESLGADVLHIPYQGFVVCALPTIYNPHDLQHRHFPGFFSPEQVVWREVLYGTGCRFAHTVAVASRWVKDDVVQHFGITPAKVQVIPWAPPTEAYAAPSDEHVAAVRTRYELPATFLLYPAQTWPHKNHQALFEALAILREERDLRPVLICTGGIDPQSWPALDRCLHELGVADQVRFLGFVPEDEIRALYRLAEALVLPTLFEAVSFPIFEAWLDGLPVACSNVTSLPEQVRDAALMFDPVPTAIAAAIADLLGSRALREELAERGRARLEAFSWERTAKAYRATYRRAGGRPLSDEDAALLGRDWMTDSP